jgi:hypothetical protein
VAVPSVASSSPTEPAASISQASVEPVPVVTTGTWLAAPDQKTVRNSQFRDVTWTGERFVATASVIEGGGGFISSSDGQTWSQRMGRPVDHPESLAAGAGGVVAIGSIDDVPASWSSPDGLAWTARTDAFPIDPNATKTDAFEVTDVVATETGWLAVGREDPYCNVNCGLAPVRSLVWSSTDGLHWTLGADQVSLAEGAMLAVSRHGTGFVAVGMANLHAAAWTSAEGILWTRAADGPELARAESDDPSQWTSMSDVTSGHGVVVGVGFEGPGGAHGPAARAWWSADGMTWAVANGEDFLSGGETSVMLASVTATADGFLAVGSSNGRCKIGMWESSDGHSWRCTVVAGQELSDLIPYAIASSDSVAVVVGLADVADPPLDGLPGAVWSRRIP